MIYNYKYTYKQILLFIMAYTSIAHVNLHSLLGDKLLSIVYIESVDFILCSYQKLVMLRKQYSCPTLLNVFWQIVFIMPY